MRAGHTLAELLIVLCIASVLLAIGAPRVWAARDQAIARSGATELVATLSAARAAAQRRDARAVVALDTLRAVARVIVGADTLLVHALGAELGVRLSASRDSVVYGPSGLGYGAANTALVVRRGDATDTVFVSRLGRVRRTR